MKKKIEEIEYDILIHTVNIHYVNSTEQHNENRQAGTSQTFLYLLRKYPENDLTSRKERIL